MPLFFHDVRWRPQKGLPYNTMEIKDLKERSFKEPPTGLTRLTVHVAVTKDMNIIEFKGKLHRISPEEPVHALLWGAADFFKQTPLDDEMVLLWTVFAHACKYVQQHE